MFTGLRVGVTTAKVLAQALRIPVIPIPSLDLLAYPLRHTPARSSSPTIDARRHEMYWAIYRPVPGGVQRVSEYELGTPDDSSASSQRAARKRWCAATASLRFPDAFADARRRRARRARARVAEPDRAGRARDRRAIEREEFCAPADVLPMYLRRSDAEIAWEREGRVMVALREDRSSRSSAHRADAPPAPARRRAHRGQVYPRPWSHSLFVSELALRSTRAYFVAKVGRDIVGYAGLMMSLTDGHVTTIAVDPAWHRHSIGTRLLLALAREAIDRGRDRAHARGAAVEQGRAGDVHAGSGSRRSACARATTPTPARTRW